MKRTKLTAWLAAFAFALFAGGAAALNFGGSDGVDAGDGTGTTGTGFPNVSDFGAAGPFATTEEGIGTVTTCTVFRPTNLGQDGLEHPIIVWGNGTSSSPSTYSGLLEHWASHGFVVAAADTSNAGTGEEMISCLESTISEFGSDVDSGRVGMSGHSQGGGGAIMAGQDSRVTTTAPMEPFTQGLGHDPDSQSNQNGPMFLMSGGDDSIAPRSSNQQPVFDNANVPVFWGTLDDASHFEPTGDAGDFRDPATAWFRFHLMDDASAESGFFGTDCDLCTDGAWTIETKGIN